MRYYMPTSVRRPTGLSIMAAVRISLLRASLAAMFLPLAFQAWADRGVDRSVDPAGLSQAQFHFKHQSFTVGNQVGQIGGQYFDEHTWHDSRSIFLDKGNALTGRLEQYDATITYPFSPRELINFDLGINIRFINADLAQGEVGQASRSLNTTLPMFYANAMFGLPDKGLSASLGASHFESGQYYALDYQAKLGYRWQNGLGMEGGWQHQELNIDGNDFQTAIESNGLFLDFKYRF